MLEIFYFLPCKSHLYRLLEHAFYTKGIKSFSRSSSNSRYLSVNKSVRYQELSVVSHKQVHQCAASKVVCAMSSGRYLNLRGLGSSFDGSRLARWMTNLDTPALPTAEQGVVASLSHPVPS